MPMDGLVVLSTYLALAGVKESRRGAIRQLKPTHLFKITSLTTFLAKKSDAKKLIYAPALVSGNYHIVCVLTIIPMLLCSSRTCSLADPGKLLVRGSV